MERFYQKLRKAAAVTAVVGAAALGAVYHPVPIVRNWGDIAARDMAAKAEVVHDIKRTLAKYGEDGRWNAVELLYLSTETTPQRIILHRTEEMRPKLLGATYFDSLHPKNALEDELYRTYNQLFSDGTQGMEKGEFASYHGIRKALFRELQKMVANKDRATLHRAKGESETEWILRHFEGSLDLSQTQLDEQLYAGLDKIEAYFSSEENQRAFRQGADSMGDARDRMYNTFLLGFFGMAGVLAVSGHDARRRKRQAEQAEVQKALERMGQRTGPFDQIMAEVRGRIESAKHGK